MGIYISYANRFQVIMIIAGLTACGGGGGGNDTNSGSNTPIDTTPDQFTFADQTGVALSTFIVSEPITITGINQRTPIDISNGEYSTDGGIDFSDEPGNIENNQIVIVRQFSSDQSDTSTTATLTVGGVSDDFTITTLDVIPDPFTFVDQTGVNFNTVIASNPVTITGIDLEAPISITDGEYSLDGGITFTSVAGTVSNNQNVTVRQTSSHLSDTKTSATLSVGGVSDDFDITTLDMTPDPFTFVDQTGVNFNTVIASNPVTITGIDLEAPIGIIGGEYSLDGGITFTSVAGTVGNNQSVIVRLTSPEAVDTQTSAILNVGDTSGAFNVTTRSDDTVPFQFTFLDQTDVDLNTIIIADQIYISGINQDAPISISNGEYSLDGGITFNSVAGTVSDQQAVIVRQTSSSQLNTETIATLTVGGVSDDFNVTTLSDTQAPSASITFPPAKSKTHANSITVRGTASDDYSEVTAVSVNGISANSSDNFLTWSVVVPLTLGDNTLTVVTTDAALNTNSNAAQAILNNAASMVDPQSITLDSANNRALVVDNTMTSLLSVDLATGNRAIISNSTTGTGSNFIDPQSVSLDSANNRVLVADDNLDALLSVDLITGNRAILSDSSNGIGVNFTSPVSVTLDNNNNRALIADAGLNAVLAVDLTNGNRTILSNSSTGTGTNLSDPRSLILDSINNRVLVVDAALEALLAVDLSNGDRSILSDSSTGAGTNFNTPSSLTLDKVNNRVLVLDSAYSALFTVDLSTGDRTVLSNYDNGVGNTFSTPQSIVLDSSNNQALIVDDTRDGVFAVDLNTGDRTVLSDGGTHATTLNYISPLAVSLDLGNNHALVADTQLNMIFWAILSIGSPGWVSYNGGNTTGPFFVNIRSIAFDYANQRILAVDDGLDALFSVERNNGNRIILSDSSTGTGTNLSSPRSVDLDSTNNRVLVVDDVLAALFSIDLTNGNRTILSDSSTGSGTNFSSPWSVITDSNNNRALLVDDGLDALFAIDFSTGNRTILSDSSTGIGTNLSIPVSIDLDLANNRALVVDDGLNALLALDLSTGNRTILSGGVTGNGTNLMNPQSIAFHHNKNVALVADEHLEALFMIDIVSGDRVLLFR